MGQFADELRREREDRGISIHEICSVTKVSLRHLEALEGGRYKDLPGGVFRKGIVRSYLAAVGLAGEETSWIERFEASLRESGASATEAEWAEFAENVRRGRGHDGPQTGVRWIGVLLMMLVLAACTWAVWHFVLHGSLVSNNQPRTSAPLQQGRM